MNTNDKAGPTPGRWDNDRAFSVQDERGGTIADVYGGRDGDDGTRHANARLIAAAPDLLAALEATVAQLDLSATMRARATNEPASVCYAVEMARKAINKARGV